MFITMIHHDEEWINIKTLIPELKPYYFISSYGRVYNINTGKLMKIFVVPNGYYAITLTLENGKQKRFYIHRLVASVFIENPNNKQQVNHINGIKSCNYKENLEWCTSRENVNHAINTRLRDSLYGTRHHKNKYNVELIEKICYLIGENKKPGEIITILNLDNPKKMRRLIKHIKSKEQWIEISNKYF